MNWEDDRRYEFQSEFAKAKYASKRAEEFFSRGEHLQAASYFAKAAFEAETARTLAAKTERNHEKANMSSSWEKRAVECLALCGEKRVEFWSSHGAKMVLDLDENQSLTRCDELPDLAAYLRQQAAALEELYSGELSSPSLHQIQTWRGRLEDIATDMRLVAASLKH